MWVRSRHRAIAWARRWGWRSGLSLRPTTLEDYVNRDQIVVEYRGVDARRLAWLFAVDDGSHVAMAEATTRPPVLIRGWKQPDGGYAWRGFAEMPAPYTLE